MKTCPSCGKDMLPGASRCKHCGATLGHTQKKGYGELMAEQNLWVGILGGIIAAFVGSLLWALITVVTGYKIGWVAVGVGGIVGYTIRTFGKGASPIFGILGALCSVGGCLCGNLVSICIFVSREEHIPVMDIVSRLDLPMLATLVKVTFDPADLVFYAIAVYEGYRFSFIRLTKEEIISTTNIQKTSG
ncbi:hypothetical protein U27_06588 [Candidatus Vecturithrix granuli]|uniref:Zinc-ribbon domain-containing protein n=1 Tax=Vecturithrix granuli TaxID=1499967 RepID=A0A081C4U8_VECG1|nr:hypothetical protein U27_06588 [Candidatus Vecturithrix granuli]